MKKVKRKLLGVEIDELKRSEVVAKLSEWVESGGRAKVVVTVYSEFLVMAGEDKEFKRALNKADLKVVDGALMLGGLRYQEMNEHGGWLFGHGLRVGWQGLRGRNGETVTGVWLFETLVEKAAEEGWRVFLLGGFGETAKKLEEKLKGRYPGLEIASDAGEQRVGEDGEENRRVVKKVNEFKPDLLMVAYGPGKQEKWMIENRRKLKTKVMMGLGGTFDEVLGLVSKSPEWMDRMGLRWLWRLVQQPKRLKRIYRGVVVCPWKLYREEMEKYRK